MHQTDNYASIIGNYSTLTPLFASSIAKFNFKYYFFIICFVFQSLLRGKQVTFRFSIFPWPRKYFFAIGFIFLECCFLWLRFPASLNHHFYNLNNLQLSRHYCFPVLIYWVHIVLILSPVLLTNQSNRSTHFVFWSSFFCLIFISGSF